MKVYKERQFLIFDFEDGKTVKYDFATKTCIGKNGKPVKNLCSQLSGITMDCIINNCVDKQYAKFLKFVKDRYQYDNCRAIYNIGTILSKVPDYAKYEQIYSAGIEDICDDKFNMGINDIPKGLIKLCRNNNISMSNNLVKFYKKNPDAYNIAYQLEYMSLSNRDIFDILTEYKRVRVNDNIIYWNYHYENIGIYITLIKEYGYTAKALLKYIDHIKTFEAIDSMSYLLSELYDYAKMMKEISPKFDKYPRHLLTTHKIACRNYNRLKQEFDEPKFKQRIDLSLKKTFGDYRFIYPKCIQDIKDEAVAQNNCVASYIDRVIDGHCHILFLRLKNRLEDSLVTIEVRNNKIVQALQRFNNPLSKEQQEIVDRWNKWRENKIKNNLNEESEEL